MGESNLINSFIVSRKVAITAASVIIVLIILDLLMTRQILPYGTASASIVETVIFILTVTIGYGVGSWILLRYTKQTIAQLRAKSPFINIMYLAVTIMQFSLLGILLFVIFNNSINCHDYFNLCNSSRILTTSIYAISSIGAGIIMGLISFKFFTWYKLSSRNFMLLFYGLAAAALAISISGDAFDKILLIQVVEEKSPLGAISQSSFIYETFEKYHGEIEYKIVNPHITTLFVVPTSLLELYNQIIYWTSLAPYILTWAGTALLLHYYYKRTAKLSLRFWIIISVPLILYLIGSGLIFSLPSDIPYRFYFRLIFRAGTIGSSVLFGLAFFIVTRKLTFLKVKDYLTITAMGIIMIGIANEISALQQTYGVAAHSLVLLSSYLVSVGLYSSAISVAQDAKLRKSIRTSALQQSSKLLDSIGTAQMAKEIEGRVIKMTQEDAYRLGEQSGVESSLTQNEVKLYVDKVLEEVKTKRQPR